MKKITLLSLSLILMTSIGFAKPSPKPDEGMWLPMFFKSMNYTTMQKMGLKLTAEELYSINNSSLKDAIVQFGNGCTGEIVSDKGLLFTNHHCGYDAIVGQSTLEHDYLNNGFWAYSMIDEIPIPDMSVSFLLSMQDVSKDILGDYTDIVDKAPIEDSIVMRIKRLTELHSENGQYKVEIKPFFESAEYYMFIYEVFTDIRLVGAPPQSIGKFGGDTDNWMWPRHTGDFSIFRVYANSENKPSKFSKDNQPYKPKHFLPISIKGVEKDDFVMIWGFPGSTERYMTSGEVENTINVLNPSIVAAGEYMLPTMKKMMEAENRVNLIYASDYAGYMNLWKNKKGELRGLKQLGVYDQKKDIEDRLTKWIEQDKARKMKYGTVVKDIEKANREISKATGTKYSWYANLGLLSNKRSLIAFQHSMTLMTMDKKHENYDMIVEMLRKRGMEHFDTYDQETEKELFKSLVIMFSKVDNKNYISQTLNKKFKGDIDAFVEKAFDKSVFADKASYEKFMKNPKKKKLNKDMIAQSALAAYSYLGADEEGLAIAHEDLYKARIRFVAALREMDPRLVQYPDANFTMRMTYGQVLDYIPADGIHYDFETTLEGVFEKEDPNSHEFQVPERLKELYLKKDYGQYANKDGKIITCFISNNDITGGNSGSPILNAEGHLIGLAFDGNWEAMSGDIAFEPEVQRTINVDARYVLFIIDKFAGAQNLIDELTIVK